MTDKKARKNKIDKKVLEYSIMGDAFIGSSFNMIGDLDNSSQNLIISMERDKIHKSLISYDKLDENSQNKTLEVIRMWKELT